ncbi:MAG: hypothetical protein ACYS8W_08820 [Planctomycetota bacterium]|jgi:hypothetical protein
MRKIALAVIFTLTISSTALASWIDIPLEKRLGEADIVVLGKITGVDNSTHTEIDVGTITVTSVLKEGGNISNVKLAWPSKRRGFATTADIMYKNGDSGIWILRHGKNIRMKFPEYYYANYPKDFQPAGRLDAVKALLKAAESGRWVSCEISRQERPKPGELHIFSARLLVYTVGNESHAYVNRKKDMKITEEKPVILSEKLAERFWRWVEDNGLDNIKTDQIKRSPEPPPTMVIGFKKEGSEHRAMIVRPEMESDKKALFQFVEDLTAACFSKDEDAGEKFLKAHPMPAEKEKKEEKSEEKQESKPSDEREEKVYITERGEKYHKKGCRYLKKGSTTISKEEAIRRGYKPCKICKP